MSKRFVIGEVGQWVSALMVMGGAITEFICKADVYYLLITCGALFWGVCQKIKHPRKKQGG